MNTQLATQESAAIAQPEISLGSVIQWAIQQNASVDQLRELYAFQREVKADQAKAAFNAAMAQFKSNPPRITKNVTKKAGSMDLNYASIDHVCDALIPALASVGIRHGWSMKQDDGKMTVTCTLTHEMGYSEGTSMTAPYDASGSKNPIQAIASAQSYLQRYTLLAATGQAAGGTDDDAVTAYPAERIGAALDAIAECRSESELRDVYTYHVKQAQDSGDKQAVAKIADAKNNQWHRIKGTKA